MKQRYGEKNMPTAVKKKHEHDIKLSLKQLIEKEKEIVGAAERLDKYLATLTPGMMDRIMTDESTPEVNAARKEVGRLLDNVMDLQESMAEQSRSFRTTSTEVRKKISFDELAREEKKEQLRQSAKQDSLKGLAAADQKSGPVLDNDEGVLLPIDKKKEKTKKRREKTLKLEKDKELKKEKGGPSI